MIDTRGYGVNGSVLRRLSRDTSLGGSYTFSNYEFGSNLGSAQNQSFHGVFSGAMGRFWTVNVEAGVTVSESTSLLPLKLDPVLAALFGASTVNIIHYNKTTYPTGSLQLAHKFQRANFTANYVRSSSAGNGVYTSAKGEAGYAALSYTGLRRIFASVDGGYYGTEGISQDLSRYWQFSAGGGLTYNMDHALHLTARYDSRHSEYFASGLNRTGYRATFGLTFSPGSTPLSLW